MRLHYGFRYRPAKALCVVLLNPPAIAPELDSEPDLPIPLLSTLTLLLTIRTQEFIKRWT